MIVILPGTGARGIGRPSRSAVSNAAEFLTRDLLGLIGLPGGEAVIWKQLSAETCVIAQPPADCGPRP